MSVLVVFDFDWSLINENSDTWVIEQLSESLYEQMKSLSSSKEFKSQWTKLMDRMVGHLMNDEGYSLDDLAACLRKIPFFQETIDAIQLAHLCGAKLCVLSDANYFYIDVILKHLGIDHMFCKVVTNLVQYPEKISSDESHHKAMRVLPYHTSHSCELCPPNLCKGLVLEEWMSIEVHTRIIYIGDGGGDFCPCTKLRTADVALCRRDWALHRKILASPHMVNANVQPWGNGEELLQKFQELFSYVPQS